MDCDINELRQDNRQQCCHGEVIMVVSECDNDNIKIRADLIMVSMVTGQYWSTPEEKCLHILGQDVTKYSDQIISASS